MPPSIHQLLEAFTIPLLRDLPTTFNTAWRRKNEHVHSIGRHGGLLGNPIFQIQVCHEFLSSLSQNLSTAIVRIIDEAVSSPDETSREELRAYYREKIGPIVTMMGGKIGPAISQLGFAPINPTFEEHSRNTVEKAENEIILACERSARRCDERIVAFQQSIGNFYMGDNNSIAGNAQSVAQGRNNRVQISGSFNSMGFPSDEIAKLFQQLHEEVVRIIPELKVKDAATLKENLTELEEEARKPSPRKDKLLLTGSGLIEAAETVGKLSAAVIPIVTSILTACGTNG